MDPINPYTPPSDPSLELPDDSVNGPNERQLRFRDVLVLLVFWVSRAVGAGFFVVIMFAHLKRLGVRWDNVIPMFATIVAFWVAVHVAEMKLLSLPNYLCVLLALSAYLVGAVVMVFAGLLGVMP